MKNREDRIQKPTTKNTKYSHLSIHFLKRNQI